MSVHHNQHQEVKLPFRGANMRVYASLGRNVFNLSIVQIGMTKIYTWVRGSCQIILNSEPFSIIKMIRSISEFFG